jgi:hypothetical protein
LEKPAKRHVAQRQDHEASCVARYGPLSKHDAYGFVSAEARRSRLAFVHPLRHARVEDLRCRALATITL